MKRIGAVALLAAAAIIAPAAADELPGSRFVSGNWRGAAYDTNKTFTHCAMNARYMSGITMFFAVSDNWTWRVMWHHAEWKLSPGQSVSIVYTIDSFPTRQLAALVVQPQLARAELPPTGQVFDEFRRGNMLTVTAEGRQYQFSLQGTNAALTRLSQCVRTQRQIAGLDPPSPPPPSPPVTAQTSPSSPPQQPQRRVWPRATAEQRLEATKVVANIMARADVGDFRILTDSDIKSLDIEYLSNADVVWQAPGLLGVLRIVPRSAGAAVDDIASELLAVESKGCKGTFASGSIPDELDSSARRMFAACETSLYSMLVRYTIVPVPDGSYYIFLTTGRQGEQANREMIDKAEASLRRAANEVLRR